MNVQLGQLPEFQKPKVDVPVVDSLTDISPDALQQIAAYFTQYAPISANSIGGLNMKITGGISTQTPGAVSTVDIPHGLQSAPSGFSAQAADSSARGAPAFYVTADGDNLTLHFASNLAAATDYVWAWTAIL